MLLSSHSTSFSANSADGTILARPFVDSATLLPQAVLVAFPGSSNGTIDIRAQSAMFSEAHFDLTEKALDVGWYRLYSLLGYRYYGFDENIRVHQTVSPIPGAIAFVPGTQITTDDNFGTRNQFQGIDMGFRSQFFIGDNWSLEVLTKIAIGRLYRRIEANGDQTISVPGAMPLVQPAGILAGGTNGGALSYSDWRALPEVGLNLNWQLTSSVSLKVGYSFLYLNNVVRAADQIDTVLNPNLFPGSGTTTGRLAPRLNIQRSDMWIQTVNLGVEWTY